ncbi:MAG TPA: PDDEXK nuclease domain-containing protein [Bacteroidales bacterium]|jgi:predicted nuclease of restriction endonuclease-like (RecB) superfamily|nr:PDDEXK nuclease domain-containing protein [Bacteroidales bacterium]HNY53939.1 PDDEXK nuclease domain-containing protein [Bacteroidales bacterium]HPS98433.1 PDDEXK nuclease domain-containing protein [Bacteroidales bacterium]
MDGTIIKLMYSLNINGLALSKGRSKRSQFGTFMNITTQKIDVVLSKIVVKMNKKIVPSLESLYSDVRNIIEAARANAYRAVNITMVKAYWNIGRAIVEEEQKGGNRAEYGTFLVENISATLSEEYGKGFDKTNLWNMIRFYRQFPILDALRQELSWTHYRILLRVEKAPAREFYLQECVDGNWSTRQLERQINSLYFERILMSSKEGRKLVKKEPEDKKENIQPGQLIKDPYVLEFLNLKPATNFYEKEIEQALIDKLKEFLLELGKGFSFVSRQYRISSDTKHFYVDLVFYNYILRCFLLIDLKTGELTHQDIGQMDFYVRFFEDQVRQESDNPTIGLILCAEKDRTIVKYSLLNESKQIFASKYKLYMPTVKELEQEITRERLQIEQEKGLQD